MNSIYRIVLPIVLVVVTVVAVALVTFIQMYSGDEERKDSPKSGPSAKASSSAVPLKIDSTLASVPPREPDGSVKGPLRHLMYWDDHVEAGSPGHYEFWCQNRNEQPVTVNVSNTNCQCASVDIAVVPPDAYRNYLIGSALSGSPFGNCLSGVVAHLDLSRKLNWLPLFSSDMAAAKLERPDQTVPAAEAGAAPQTALVRLNWKGNGEGTRKVISAELFARIGDAAPAHTHLEANIRVVAPFEILQYDGANRWRPFRELQFGELRDNSISKQTLYLASATRSYLNYSIAPERADPCITFADPVPASDDEVRSLREFVASAPADQTNPLPGGIKSLQKIEITVHERAESQEDGKKVIRQLDLGPLDRKAKVTASDGGAATVAIRGRVFGEITLLSGADSGAVELGQTIAADQTHTRSVSLLAERAGLDLAIEKSETFPAYLQESKLEPLPDTKDGRKSWVLRVILPKNSLYGPLPEGSAIVLKTTGPNPRRFRIPVRGSTFQSSGPRL